MYGEKVNYAPAYLGGEPLEPKVAGNPLSELAHQIAAKLEADALSAKSIAEVIREVKNIIAQRYSDRIDKAKVEMAAASESLDIIRSI